MKTTTRTNLVFLSWAPYCSRSDSIAARLGGASYMVYSPIWGSTYVTVLFKYATQLIRSLVLLLRLKPKVVLVMTPPVAACVAAWCYSKLSGAAYIIDAHSGALVDPRWQSTLFLHRFFSRQACTTIVTNPYLEALVRDWGAHVTIVSDVPVEFPPPADKHLKGGSKITLVSSFTFDEPIGTFLDAARQEPDTTFYVTGDCRSLAAPLLQGKPQNVEFTGFLPAAEYAGLLRASDAIVTLTTLNHTMQRGAYEAVYLGKPVIVTNSAVLREAFDRGAVHVENTVEDIVRGIRRMKQGLDHYTAEAQELRRLKLERWRSADASLRALIDGPGRTRQRVTGPGCSASIAKSS